MTRGAPAQGRLFVVAGRGRVAYRLGTRKRLVRTASVVSAIVAITSFAAGVTYGRFSSTKTSNSNTFTSGTVTVGTTGTQFTCSISGMNPGDSSTGAPIGTNADHTCQFTVQYTGTVSAFLAVDVAITNGSTALYDGSTQGLQLYLADGQGSAPTPYGGTSYLTSGATNSDGTQGTTYAAQHSNTATTLPTTGISDLLVSSTPASTGTIVHFSLDYALPADSATSYENGSVTVVLTFHAVQSANNALPTGTNSCSAGQRCTTGMAWS